MLAVSAFSFIKHLGKDNTKFYVLCSGLSNHSKQTLIDRIGGGNVIFIDVDENIFSSFNNTVGLPKEALYRLLGIELLPEVVHKILYADIDILCVSDDVKLLFDYSWNSSLTIAAVPDAGISDKYAKAIMGVALKNYFNTGVLFFNVDYCRKVGLWSKSRDLLEGNTFKAVDQDILNILFKDNYYTLSNRFNYMSPQIFKDMMFYRRKSLLSGFEPVLIHYDGPHKPWYLLCANPYKRLYNKYQGELNLKISRKLKRGIVYKLKLFLQFIKIELASL